MPLIHSSFIKSEIIIFEAANISVENNVGYTVVRLFSAFILDLSLVLESRATFLSPVPSFSSLVRTTLNDMLWQLVYQHYARSSYYLTRGRLNQERGWG